MNDEDLSVVCNFVMGVKVLLGFPLNPDENGVTVNLVGGITKLGATVMVLGT